MSSLNFLNVSTDLNMDLNYNNGFEYYFINPANSLTITMTATVYEGLFYEFIRIDGVSLFTVVINGNGKTINGNNSVSLLPNQRTKLVYTNGSWISIKSTISLL